MTQLIAAERISTDRLDLLPLAVAHAGEMAGVLADPALHEFIGGEPLTTEALRARFERWVAGSSDPTQAWLNWVVRLSETGELTGTIQATVTLDAPTPYAELAWVIGVPWQRRGIASEASVGVANWLRDNGMGRLVAHIHPDHSGSAAVAHSVGLRPTGIVVDGEIEWSDLSLG